MGMWRSYKEGEAGSRPAEPKDVRECFEVAIRAAAWIRKELM